MKNGHVRRVCIIGAGASGLPSIKSCLERGLEPVCFERNSELGGIWYYTDVVDGTYACVMKCVSHLFGLLFATKVVDHLKIFQCAGCSSTSGNTSKKISAFSDFPPPKEWPNYWHNKFYWQYLNDYAEHFHLQPYIKFAFDSV